MKKQFLLISLVFISVSVIFSQNNNSPAPQLDEAVSELAQKINKMFTDEKAEKISISQISYLGTVPPLGVYWNNQLTAELTNITGRTYAILSSAAGADWTVTGEIVDISGVIRVYTRLIRQNGRIIEGVFNFDFERTAALAAMLPVPAANDSSSSNRPALVPDEWEPDSFDNPVPYEIGDSEESAVLMERNLHIGGDEDFFILIPDANGRLVMETTGSTDTFMELYDADNPEQRIAYNDDGGQGTNARIRYNVEADHVYIVKVRGYNERTTGSYSFRAYLTAASESSSSWSNPIVYEPGVYEDDAPIVERELEEDGEDYFLIIPGGDGRLTLETIGNELDTYMELYDAETRELLAENDDGGQGYNARIRINVEAGKSYIAKITEYDGDSGKYSFRAYIYVEIKLDPDEYEPDDEPSQASWIEIGTPQQHTFHSPDDVDWVKFQVTQPGRHTIRTRGVVSNRLDTYIQLYDANLNLIAEDDDGGENLDSRLSRNLTSGLYYLKVWCLSEEPDQPYTIRIDRE